MIDLHVISRDGWVNGALVQWLSGRGSWAVVQGRYSVAQARNRSVKRFLAGAAEWLVQIDADIVPLAETEALLRVSDDRRLAYCVYPPRTPGPGVFPGYLPGCARMHRALLAGMRPPWFEAAVEEDGCNFAHGQGEERRLLLAARACGVEPVRVGFAAHLVEIPLRYEDGRVAW